jgi:hypothetical protein
MAAAWWDFAPEDTRNDIAAQTGVDRSEDNHAAPVETSLLMHVAPGAVREHLLTDDDSARRVRYLILPPPDDVKTQTGVIYQARRPQWRSAAASCRKSSITSPRRWVWNWPTDAHDRTCSLLYQPAVLVTGRPAKATISSIRGS